MITIQHTSIQTSAEIPTGTPSFTNKGSLKFQYVLDDIDHYNRTIHENPPITHNKKTRALIENWQMNDGTNHPVFPNPLGTETHDSNVEPIPKSLLHEKQFQNVLITRDGEPDCITCQPTSTSNAKNACFTSQWTLGN